MILLRPRSHFYTQKTRRGMTEKVARPEREANIVGRSALVDALSPVFDQTNDQLRADVEGELRAQRLAGRSRLSVPIRALELNQNRFRDDMQEAMLEGISVGGDIGIRHTGVEGIDLDADLVTDRARNWVRGPGTERIVDIQRRQQRQIRRSIDRTLREDIPANEAIRRISRNVGLTEQQQSSLARFEERLIRQRLPSPEADVTVFVEDPADQQRLIGRQAVRETIQQDVENARRRMIRERSQTILETEMQTAIQEGERQFYEEAIAEGQINRDFLEKRWFTVLDDRVCAICEPLHGKVLEFDEDFSSGPFSGLHPPAHPRCRCFIEYKPTGEFGGQEDEGGPELLGEGVPSRRERITVGAEETLGFLETVEPIEGGFRFPELPDRRFVPEEVSISVAEPQRPSFLRPLLSTTSSFTTAISTAALIRDVIADPRGIIATHLTSRIPPRALGRFRQAGRGLSVLRDPRGSARRALRAVGRGQLRRNRFRIRRLFDDAFQGRVPFDITSPRTLPTQLVALPGIDEIISEVNISIPTSRLFRIESRRSLSKQRPRTRRGSRGRERRRRFGNY